MFNAQLDDSLEFPEATAYRLVYRGIARDANRGVLVPLLESKLDLPRSSLRAFLSLPPRPLWLAPDVEQARKGQAALARLGFLTTFEEVATDLALPCPVAISTLESLSDGRPRHQHPAVMLVSAIGDSGQQSLLELDIGALAQSMGAGFSGQLLDSRHLLLCGPGSSRDGIVALRYRLLQELSRRGGDASRWQVGLAFHPADGRTPIALIAAAHRRAQEDSDAPPSTTPGPAAEPPVSAETDPARLALTQARGTSLARLLASPPGEIAAALGSFDAVLRRAFVERLWLDAGPTERLLPAASPGWTPPAGEPDQVLFAALGQAPAFLRGLAARRNQRALLIERLEHHDELPALPQIATRIMQLGLDADADTQELTRLIEQDPALTARLLRLVNSAWFGFSREITATQHAVIILGADEIIKLAMTLATSRLFHVDGSGFTANELLGHASGVALIATSLSERHAPAQAASAYTAGLLHDIGRIFLLQQFPSEYSAICTEAREQGVPLFEVEEDRFGMDHAQIGLYLANVWNLPPVLSQAIGGHHRPPDRGDYAAIAATVGLADRLYHFMTAPQERCQSLSVTHLKALHLNYQDLMPESLALMTEDLQPLLDKARQLAGA